MSKLTWDSNGERWYESGVDHGVLYKLKDGAYKGGVAWNGLTNVTESPDGAEANDMWADNIKYGSLRSAETFGGTIEAYQSPEEFEECDGSAEIAVGVYISQQDRKAFGFSYRTKLDNDTTTGKYYKLHLVYNATASPSERAYETINDSPEAITLSWEFETTPVAVSGYNSTSHIVIDTSKVDATKLAALEAKLYGDDENEAELPLPDEIIAMFADTSSEEATA